VLLALFDYLPVKPLEKPTPREHEGEAEKPGRAPSGLSISVGSLVPGTGVCLNVSFIICTLYIYCAEVGGSIVY
jgi:hypothetical protein